MEKKLLRTLVVLMALMTPIGVFALEQKDGVYQIGSAADLTQFIQMVNEDGQVDIDAVLTADVEYTNELDTLMVGTTENRYAGTFDGKGHTVTVNYDFSYQDDAALFRFITGTVKNLIVKGEIKVSRKFAAGIAAHSYGATIENCISLVNITSTLAGDGTHAGILAVADGGVIVNNCVFAGTMAGGNTTSCGGIVGWASTTTIINSCLMLADITTNRSSSYLLCRNPGNVVANNCVTSTSWGATANDGSTAVTPEELASGAACFMLNGDQSNITMYQTIGTDAYPVPFSEGHQRVYAVGQLNCDGTPVEGTTLTYSNSEGSAVPAHQYELGVCVNCGASQPDYIDMVDGYYQLASPEHLKWFSNQVQNGKTSVKGQLVADIDMTGWCDDFVPIGTLAHPFTGTFDGQEHTISNLVIEEQPNASGGFDGYFGFVGAVSGGVVVENLILDNTCSIAGNKFTGMVGASTGSGTVTIRNLANEGDVSTVNENAAGIMGCNVGSGCTFLISNCYSTGHIVGGKESAAISGWVGSNAVISSCWTTAVVEGIQDENHYVVRYSGSLTLTNTYSLYGTQGNLLDESTISTGALCFILNGDQKEIGWYQDLGKDEHPWPFSSHAQVYYGAAMRCDGTPLGSGDSYTNTPSGEIPPHEYEDGFCRNCGQADANYLTQDEEGFYEIGEPANLVWYGSMVNMGNNSIKGKLTADLDMDEYPDFAPIGTSTNPFKGSFNGQNHVISNLTINRPEEEGVGLFGFVNGCTIENLILDKTCSITGSAYVGLVGESSGGTVTLTRLGNEGTVTALGRNAGGIIGCNMGSAATYNITQCYTTGAVIGDNESGAICGWVGTNAVINDCWSISEVTGIQDDAHYFYRFSSETHSNCWSLNGTQVNKIDENEVFSGALTYKMNGNGFTSPIWYQSIGDDEHPVWDDTHGIVYHTSGDTYADVHDAVSYKEFQNDCLNSEYKFCESVIATQSLVDAYRETLNNLTAITNMVEFAEAYSGISAERTAVEESEAAYAAYQTQIEYVVNYLDEHDDFAGEDRDILVDYLESDLQPDETFVNGSYSHIWEKHTLSTAEIKEETTRVAEMLATAVANGYSKGSEVTRLMTNPDFSDGSNGWTLNYGSRPSTATVEGMGSAAENWNNRVDLSQTITGLSNGLYELQMNGHYRWNADLKGVNYAGMVYANGVQTYLPLEYEEYLPVEEAVDGENCLLTGSAADYEMTDDEGNVIGYVPLGPVGCTYAYKNGRYINKLVAEVTDGTLTVGVKNPRQLVTSGMWYGNFRLIYLGELEDATEGLDATLEGMVARSNVILDTYEYSVENPNAYPNYSLSLNEQLRTLVEAAGAASNNEEKMELIKQFSSLFQAIEESERAYAKMVAEAEALQSTAFDLSDAGYIEEGDPLLREVDDAYNNVWEAFIDGNFSTEQANTEGHQMLRQNKLSASQVDGVYQINNLLNFVWFAQVTNVADPNMDAVLTTDIDYSSQSTMIGTSSEHYAGTFDGQDHKITVAFDRTSDDAALFRFVSGTIKNLETTGTINTSAKFAAGIAAHSYGGTFDHCASDVQITGSISGDGTHAGIVAVTDGGGTVSYCSFGGSMSGANTTNSGGIVGWCTTTTTIDHCLMLADISLGTSGSYTICRNPGQATISNCFYKAVFGSANDGSIQIADASTIATGEFTYEYALMYGEGDWFQRLEGDEIDAYPVPFASHGKVYCNGDLRCDGHALDADCTYSNTKTNEIPAHQYVDAVCVNCQGAQPGFMTPSEYNGIAYYWISNAKQLEWFAAKVNSGDTHINGALTADIDMSSVVNHITIGKGNQSTIYDARFCYAGIFDGNGHTISHFVHNSPDKYQGLFGGITGGFTLRNLVLDSTCSISGGSYTALVGCSLGSGEVLIQNVGNEGTVTSSGVNAGGIIGCCMGSTCHFTLENCYVTGRVDGLQESAAISGWLGSNANVTNCWTTSDVTGIQGYEYYFARRGSAEFVNCYCLTSLGGTQVNGFTWEQMINGELTYMLNEGNTDPETIVWFQTLEKDEHPVFDKSHQVVCKNDDGTFYNVESGIEVAVEELAEEATEPALVNVYDLQGRLVRANVSRKASLQNLPRGLYVVGRKKVLVK